MTNYNKKGHIVGTILTIIVVLGLIAAVIALSVQLSRTATTTLGGDMYSIGTLDSETGEYVSGDTAIYTRKGVSSDGLKCELAENATVNYQLFFYDKDGEFISATQILTSDYNGENPEGAKTVKVMIIPTSDEDSKVSVVEIFGYANQLTVTVNAR